MDVKLFRAFIASPGGLEVERKAAFAAAAEVNRSVALPLGARIELLGWEETLSGTGRPQAIINAEMETCDLFIGVMWTKWGSSPSLEGPYSSGFEEEFELSRKRYAETRLPIMAMFFKEVDSLQLSDPGDDLKRVLAFQDRLKAEKSFLYETFGNAEAFAAKVRIFLSTHIIRSLNATVDDVDSRQTRTADGAAKADTMPVESDVVEGQFQPARGEAAFLDRVAKTLRRSISPSGIDVARLRLVAASTKTNGNDHLLIGAHDANILYENRMVLDLSDWEKRTLLVAGLAGQPNQNVPLWSWLGALDGGQPALLLALTILGEDAERVGAINVMRLLRRPIAGQDQIDAQAIIRSWFDEDRAISVKLAALHYLRDMGRHEDLEAVDLEVAQASKDTNDAALAAAFSILLRFDPRAAMSRLLRSSFEAVPATIVQTVLEYADDLSTEELMLGLDHRSSEVRATAVNILGARSALSIETLKRACEDDAALVRLAAVEALDVLGQTMSLDEISQVLGRSHKPTTFLFGSSGRDSLGEALFDRYREKRLMLMSIPSLRALLSSNEHQHAAYRMLAARNVDDFAKKLRADVRDDFNQYVKLHWPNGVGPGPNTVFSGLLSRNTDLNELKRRQLVQAALDTIVTRRDGADLALVRQALDSSGIVPSRKIISYLSSLGDHSDIARLARVSRFSWPGFALGEADKEFIEAASAILKMAKGQLDKALSAEIPNAMIAKMLELASWPELSKLTDDQILNLLLSEDGEVRRSAARRLGAALPRRRVEKTLSEYRNNPGGVYYVVTHWLDVGIGLSQRVARGVVSRSE